MLTDQEKAFWDFYNSARHNKVLDDKTSLMIHMAASMAVGCYPCMRHYHMQKKTVGLTEDEVHAIESIVMAVSAGRVMMQHNQARTGDREQNKTSDGCGGPC